MKPNLPLQARMLRLYQRFQQSNLTRAAFCREEGITAAQFTYWCRRFEQESDPDDASPTSITLSQLSTPIQAVKEPVEREAFAANPVAEPIPAPCSGFTQLHLPDPPATPVQSVCPTAVISIRPMMVLNLAEKGRLEFYTPVEASFLKTLLG
jgi:transposase-like protein